jgi:hypothetical protein
MEVEGHNIMRRQSDGWLNATQILKVANVEKAKRTKVLDRLIGTALHEKVQGGYAGYQGTWIPFEQGLEFAREYRVDHLLKPLSDIDMNKSAADFPTKEQAMAAQRQRRYTSGIDNTTPDPGLNDTYVKRISTSAINALAVINKAGIDSRSSRGPFTPSSKRQSQPTLSQDYSTLIGSQQSTQTTISGVAASEVNAVTDSAYGTQQQQQQMQQQLQLLQQQQQQQLQQQQQQQQQEQQQQQQQHPQPSFQQQQKRPLPLQNEDDQERPRKRARPTMNMAVAEETAQAINLQESFYGIPHIPPGSPTEPNESFMYNAVVGAAAHEEDHVNDGRMRVAGPMALEPLPDPETPEEIANLDLLKSVFFVEKDADVWRHEAFERLSGAELDRPVDPRAHTVLHWAATLGRLEIVKALVQHGASIYRVNVEGETALMRACATTNSADEDTFLGLLEVLGPTIVMTDCRGRSVLHHIALTSGIAGREACTKHYLEALLGYVIRRPSNAPISREPSFNGPSQAPDHASSNHQRPSSLGRFITEIVNLKDTSGDTALNIAARVGSKNIVAQLMEIGADPDVPNLTGLKPSEFGASEPTGAVGPHLSQFSELKLAERSISRLVTQQCQGVYSSKSPPSPLLCTVLPPSPSLFILHSAFVPYFFPPPVIASLRCTAKADPLSVCSDARPDDRIGKRRLFGDSPTPRGAAGATPAAEG